MLKRRYYTMFRLGQFDTRFDKFEPIDFAAHGKQARQIAEQGSVLLKNESATLPLNAKSLRSVALFGSKTFAGAAKFPKTGHELSQLHEIMNERGGPE